jgi:hypothetical protein
MAAMAALAILDQHMHTLFLFRSRSPISKNQVCPCYSSPLCGNVQMCQHEMVTWPHAPHCFVPPLPHPMLAHVFANTSSAAPLVVVIVVLVGFANYE